MTAQPRAAGGSSSGSARAFADGVVLAGGRRTAFIANQPAAAGYPTGMADLGDRRRLARVLIARFGRGLAEPCGFPVSNNAANLFQLLCLSLLISGRGDYRQGVQVARALRDRWDNADRTAGSPYEQRVQVIRDAGERDAEGLAGTIGDLAQAVVDRYEGDLRRLRVAAGQRRDPERRLLKQLPGVDDRAVDTMFREIQVLWPEVAPFADEHALTAARRLGLGSSSTELAAVAGGGKSEKLAWLAGALARVDLENSYEEIGPVPAG